MSVQQLPLELEKIIYNFAFAIDAQFIADNCFKYNNYLKQFIEEHSTFLTDKIDWFELFYILITKIMESWHDHENLIKNLTFLMSLIDKKLIKINKKQLAMFYGGVRAFGGDNLYEYFLDDHPYIEDVLIKLSKK